MLAREGENPTKKITPDRIRDDNYCTFVSLASTFRSELIFYGRLNYMLV